MTLRPLVIAASLLATGLYVPAGAEANAPAATKAKTGDFNFDYAKSGETSLLPLQVFDDGQNTYFQFRNKNSFVPAILVDNGDYTFTATPQAHGPYVVVPGVAQRFILGHNTLRAKLDNNGSVAGARIAKPVSLESAPSAVPAMRNAAWEVAAPRPRAVATFGATAPMLGDSQGELRASPAATSATASTVKIPFAVNSANLTPDVVKKIRAAVGDSEIVSATVIGRDDLQYREGIAAARAAAIVAALTRVGVSRQAITVREGFPSETDSATRPTSDLTLRLAPRAVQVSSPGPAPTSVRAALANVKNGLNALVSMGAIAESVASGIFSWLQSNTNMGVSPERTRERVEQPVDDSEQWVMTGEDQNMARALERWGRKAGYSIDWTASYDIPVQGNISFRGNFLSAVTTAMEQARKRAPSTFMRIEGRRIVIGEG